jgi:thiamine pyrophosphate-dependent acetolactate synthase large subunit-like protein
MQELQFVAARNLPILIVVVNNNSSGMILSRQRKRKSMHCLHTTTRGDTSLPHSKMLQPHMVSAITKKAVKISIK